jgi:Domain of unknown function (DUF588)
MIDAKLKVKKENACRFFVIGNAIAAGYLVLSLPFSAVTVIRSQATGLRLLLLIFDTVINFSTLLH